MNYENLNFLKLKSTILLNALEEGITTPYFFVKDTKERVLKIGRNPDIETKGIVFNTIDNISILLLAFRFNNDDDLIYSQWCNYYNQNCQNALNNLMLSDFMNFCIIDENNNKVNTFKSTNRLRFLLNGLKNKKGTTILTNKEFQNITNLINDINMVELFNNN